MSDGMGGTKAPGGDGLAPAIDALEDGVYRLDAEGRFLEVNDAIVKQTGYDRETLLGSHVSLILAADDVEELERAIQRRLETGLEDGETYDLVVETADGVMVPCELRFSLLREDGRLVGSVGVVRATDHPDQTRSALTSVWETYETIASVIDEAEVGVFVLDENFDVVWVNETTEEYFGLDRTAVVGRDKRTLIEETICPRLSEPEWFRETVFATYEDNTYVEQFQCRVTPEDGEGRWLEHRSRPLEDGPYEGGRIELYYDVTERRRSERARRESEARFESFVSAVDEYAIITLTPTGDIASWNEGAFNIKGYTEEDILGEHVSRLYTDQDRAAGVPAKNLAGAREQGSIEREGWRIRADGTKFWASITISAIFEDDELQGYVKVTRDMTDRREREQRLQHERDLVERILETSSAGIAVVGPEGDYQRANQRMADLLGVETVDSDTVDDIQVVETVGSDLKRHELPSVRVRETGDPLVDQEIRVDPPDGDQRWLSVTAAPIDESADQVVVTATDVTDLRELAERRREELLEREKELAGVQVAAALLEPGEDPLECVLEEFLETLPASFQFPHRTEACVSVGDQLLTTADIGTDWTSVDATTQTTAGTPIELSVAIRPGEGQDTFTEEEQAITDTLATLVRFHVERRESREALEEKTRRLEQFAYAASHDLQEPLRMVASYLQLLESRYGDRLDEDGREFLAFAVDGAERMSGMIDGLLEFSRVETRGNPLEPIDLDAVIEDVLEDLQFQREGTDASVTIGSMPTVLGDGRQLRQVFQNLLSNAFTYSGDAPPEVRIEAARAGPMWEVAVHDEGIGIDPADQDRIFSVFERIHDGEDHEGTGLGLPLVRRIVERHGGELRVESAPDEGSTFVCTLPAVPDG